MTDDALSQFMQGFGGSAAAASDPPPPEPPTAEPPATETPAVPDPPVTPPAAPESPAAPSLAEQIRAAVQEGMQPPATAPAAPADPVTRAVQEALRLFPNADPETVAAIATVFAPQIQSMSVVAQRVPVISDAVSGFVTATPNTPPDLGGEMTREITDAGYDAATFAGLSDDNQRFILQQARYIALGKRVEAGAFVAKPAAPPAPPAPASGETPHGAWTPDSMANGDFDEEIAIQDAMSMFGCDREKAVKVHLPALLKLRQAKGGR